MNDFWNSLIGKVDDETALAKEQEKVAKLRVASERLKERQAIQRQLLTLKKERRELESVLRVRNKVVLYALIAGAFLILLVVIASC